MQIREFRETMKDLGYIEGRDYTIDARFAETRYERLAPLAADVVASNPAVIVTASSAAVMALKKATSSLPIVFATAIHPVAQGFVASLQRPGGNVTGVALYVEMEVKLVEFVREILPAARRLGVLVNRRDPVHKLYLDSIESAATHVKLEPVVVRIAQLEDFEGAIKELADRKVDAVLIPNQTLLAAPRLAALALNARLPLFSSFDHLVKLGGLLSYGTLPTESYRQAAKQVDRIMRGAKPGDLPVEQPTRFRLVVNLKTAKTLGITLPPAIMLRADGVIE